MAKNFGVECFPRNYCVTFTLCAVIVVLAILCIPQSVHGNHVPQPGSRNANPTRGRNIRPEVRTTPQRRRGSPQQQAPSRAASSSRRFSVQQNARAATQQRASASRRTNQRGEPSSRTRQGQRSRSSSRDSRRTLNVRNISNRVSSRGRLRPGSDTNGRVRPMENADANKQLNNRGNLDLFPSSINQFINKLKERIPNIGLGLGVHIQDPEGNSQRSSSSTSRSRSRSSSRSSSGSVMDTISQLGSLFNRRRNSPPSNPSPSSTSSRSNSQSSNDISVGSNVRGQGTMADQWQPPSQPPNRPSSQFLASNQLPPDNVVVQNVQGNPGLFNSGFPQAQPNSMNTVNVNPIPQPVVHQPQMVPQPSFGFPQQNVVHQQPPTFSLQQQHQQIQHHQQHHHQQLQQQQQHIQQLQQLHQQQQLVNNQVNSFRLTPPQAPVQSMIPQPQISPNVVVQQAPQQIQSFLGQQVISPFQQNQQPFQLNGNQNMLMQQQAIQSSGTIAQPMQVPMTNTNTFQLIGNQQSTNVKRPVLPTPAPVMTQAIQTNGQTIINGAGRPFQSPQSVIQMSFNPSPSQSQTMNGQQNLGLSASQTPGQFVNAQGQIFNLQPSSQNTYQVINGQLVPVQQSFQLFPTGQTVPPGRSQQQAIPSGQVQMSAFETNLGNGVRRAQNPQTPTRVPFSFGLFASKSGPSAKISNLTSQAKQLVEHNAQIEMQNQLLQQLLIEQVLNSHGVNTTSLPPTANQTTPSNSFAIPSNTNIQPAAVAFNWREGTAVNKSNDGIRRVVHGSRSPGGVKVISLRAANTVSPFNRSAVGVTLSPSVSRTVKNSSPAAVRIVANKSYVVKPTYDPEVLPQYRNSKNATLRSMDRTDRLNTTDIPEEIEINGMSLDSPADRNGVGTPHPLDSYVHGVHGHNNMGTRPVTPATAFGMGYGTRKNESLHKMDRTDRLNTTDIPEEIEVNGQSLDSPADRNGMNIHHPLDYLVHGVSASGGAAQHNVQASYNRPAPPPEEPEEMFFTASQPGYIDTTIGLGTNVMDMKHFRDPSLFDAVSHQAYELMHHLQFSLSRIPSNVLHGIQYWMPNIPYDVFMSIKNSAPRFYQGFHDSVGNIPMSVAQGIINLVDMIRHSSAKTTKPVKTVASKIAKVLHDSFTSPKPTTTQSLYDFRIFDMIQLTTTPPMPITTPSPVRHSAKTLAKLMNLVKLLVHEPSTTTTTAAPTSPNPITVAPQTNTTTPVSNTTMNANTSAPVSSNTNALNSTTEVLANISVTKVDKSQSGQTNIDKVSVTVNKKKSVVSKPSPAGSVGQTPRKTLPPNQAQNLQQQQQKRLPPTPPQNVHRQQQQNRLPPTAPHNSQQQQQNRLPPTPPQNSQQQQQNNRQQQERQERERLQRQQMERERQGFQNRRLPPTPPQGQQEIRQSSNAGPGIRLPPTLPQDQPQNEGGFHQNFGHQNTGNARRGETHLNQVVQPRIQKPPKPAQRPQSTSERSHPNTVRKHGIFEIQNLKPNNVPTQNIGKNSNLNGRGMNSKPKLTTDYPTQVPPKLIPDNNNYPTQVPPKIHHFDNKIGFRHERIATPPVYQHPPIVTEAYNTRPHYQQPYPTMPSYQPQPITTTVPSVISTAPYYDSFQQRPRQHQQQQQQQVDYYQPNAQQNSPDYNYQNSFYGDGVTNPTATEGFGFSAQAQNSRRQPIENTIQYKEFSNAHRKGFSISEVFGKKK
ncbi:uncharacterized protein LOC128170453 [Crassostrea angulata]|uniref:uncharacterized protein LOC128170453 n=1 Tax=Magallana angulata TaxID=2784310 RepID=UPI0022B1F0CB|nr:uncharacterized protein LOC128170453 [Crassostrea angulata]